MKMQMEKKVSEWSSKGGLKKEVKERGHGVKDAMAKLELKLRSFYGSGAQIRVSWEKRGFTIGWSGSRDQGQTLGEDL